MHLLFRNRVQTPVMFMAGKKPVIFEETQYNPS